jgi:hypothetical protein
MTATMMNTPESVYPIPVTTRVLRDGSSTQRDQAGAASESEQSSEHQCFTWAQFAEHDFDSAADNVVQVLELPQCINNPATIAGVDR